MFTVVIIAYFRMLCSISLDYVCLITIFNSCFSLLQFTDYNKCFRNICRHRRHTITKSDFLIMSLTIVPAFSHYIIYSVRQSGRHALTATVLLRYVSQ